MINKRGDIYSTISIMGTVLLVLCIVFGLALGGFVLKDTMGTVFTEVRSIQNITDNVNVTYYADKVFSPVETILDNYALYAGILYIMGIILIFTLAFVFRENANGLTMALFVAAALLIIAFTIILSNTYETFYNGADFIGTGLRDATMVSYLIIYSPAIMSVVIFIAGIILMTGRGNNP
jgi:hypothetical protein